MRILLRVSLLMYYRYGTELGITTGVQTTEHEYLYMAAAASTNRSLRVFTLISTGGTASSSLHAAFNKPPPSRRHLKRVKGSEGVCLWLPCAPLFADLANQSGHLHRNCHDCSPFKSGTMCAAATHCVRACKLREAYL